MLCKGSLAPPETCQGIAVCALRYIVSRYLWCGCRSQTSILFHTAACCTLCFAVARSNAWRLLCDTQPVVILLPM